MANKSGKKCKKPLQTTLGKANCQTEKDVDLSHVQKPINTSIFGLKQVLSLFQTATKEVQNYISYECDIMYECRMCRTIFRSLANFILHKRNYCREQFNHLDLLNNNGELQESTSSRNTLDNVETEGAGALSDPKTLNTGKKTLSPVIDRLKEKQEICQLAQEVLNEDFSTNNVNNPKELDQRNKNDELLFEKIATNNAAVFQTVLQNLPRGDKMKQDFMKSEVMEIHGILDSDEAVLGPDGKICTFGTNKANENPIIPKNNLVCTECNLKFSTKKTLTYHIKYKHNNTRLVYVCPDCKDTFANAWCVYRHLYKIHRRTSAQIKRMRDQIYNSCIRKDQEPVKKKDKKTSDDVDKTDEENQWLSNIEGDNEFQMCGGCGKRFERKAALHSHAQMCTKRIAVCNTIRENNAKKKEEECRYTKNKNSKAEKVEGLKGSSKRKPYLLRMYKSNETKCDSSDELLHNIQVNDTCDVNANCEIVETNCDNNKDIVQEETANEENAVSTSDDISSPNSKDFVSSPSIEKIDTEKMLHIIGIPNNYENISSESKTNSKFLTEEQTKSDQNFIKESTSHTASDFDLFCQSVVGSLLTVSPEDISGDTEDGSPKAQKTIPLILRRKTTSRSEKKKSYLEKSDVTLQNNNSIDYTKDLSDTKDEVETHNQSDKEDSLKTTVGEEYETDSAEKNTNKDHIKLQNNLKETSNKSGILELDRSNSTIKISVKNLEDLIGVSPNDHKKTSEICEPDINHARNTQLLTSELTDTSDIDFKKPTTTNVSYSLPAHVYPDKIIDENRKCLKRRRTSSLDFTDCSKIPKKLEKISPNKRDPSFISRASPYMDQNKLLCIPCQASYPSLSTLLWHMSAHFSWFRFQCSRCSFISFNKLDCANHAKKTHFVKKMSIESVVLPIPNWKTVLMSHDFCMLNNASDLSGKHTDEVISGNLEVPHDQDFQEKTEDGGCNEADWTHKLFVESNNSDENELENDSLGTSLPVGCNNIKQEGIDVIDNLGESFQIEVPQEMYTLNVSEILEGFQYEERFHDTITKPRSPQIKIENMCDDNESNSINYLLAERDPGEAFFDEVDIKTEILSDEEMTNESIDKTNKFNKEVQGSFKQDVQNSIKMRPTRNRTRSIKTIQDDFFYDLSKVIKLNDTSLSKTNLQKLKKSVHNALHKNSKASVSSKIDNETKLRVYSKK